MSETTSTPRQRGRSKSTIDLIDTCFHLIQQCQPISVRGVCYKLFVDGYIDSMATKNCARVSRTLTDARENGIIPWEWIVDESRQMECTPHWSNLEEYARVIERSYRRDFWADQQYKVILISEKGTIAGVIRPVLEEYGVPFMVAHGFTSSTKAHELADQVIADPREHKFLYIGDHDPSGMFMSEVDLPDRLIKYGATNFNVERIALTEYDIKTLPDFPAKTTDPRFKWYASRYGNRAYELDAMDPQDLRERVKASVLEYIDSAAWGRHKVCEAAQQASTRMIAEQMAAITNSQQS